jgi:NAD-dependent deacetylase
MVPEPTEPTDPTETSVPADAAVAAAHALISAAERITVLSGAGISTDSGIPDFRGPQGVWTKNPEAEKQATLQNYMSDPEVRRRAWRSRLDHRAFSAEPNAGHAALVELQTQGRLRALVTQNIDGLHQAAGSDPDLVVEVHGTVHDVVCMACDDRAPMQVALDRVRAGDDDPECRICGGILKSATISFGQSLDTRTLLTAEAAARDCDLLLAVGTTLGVYPIAGIVPLAASHGARVVILNAEETAFDDLADVVVRARIGDVLPRMVRPA